MTILIVNYESWSESVRLVRSLAAEPEFRSGACEVVVVDNATRGPIPDPLLSPGGGVRVIAREENGGFAAGVNTGWRAARSPWLLILNPDVEVAEGFLRGVFHRLDRYHDDPGGRPGIVGFALRNPDGTRQGSVGAFPTLARSIREQFIPRSRRKYQTGWRIRPGRVDWVTGACMLVNADLIADLGGMDEDFFLYHEEVAFSRVAQGRGWRVEFDPSLSVIHRHPLQNRAISPKMRVITRHSKLLYFLKHLPRWQFGTLAWMVRLEAAVRGPWSRMRGHEAEGRAWRTIAGVADRMSRGETLRGREILALADAVERPDQREGIGGTPDPARPGRPGLKPETPTRGSGPARMHRRGGRAGSRPPGHRKDGSA